MDVIWDGRVHADDASVASTRASFDMASSAGSDYLRVRSREAPIDQEEACDRLPPDTPVALVPDASGPPPPPPLPASARPPPPPVLASLPEERVSSSTREGQLERLFAEAMAATPFPVSQALSCAPESQAALCLCFGACAGGGVSRAS